MRLLLASSLAKGFQYEALFLQLVKIVDTHYIALSWPVTQLLISHAKKKKKKKIQHAAYFICTFCWTIGNFHFTLSLSWRETRISPPSCPLSSSDNTTAMDKNHQFVRVGESIVTHEDEGMWLVGFEVMLQTDR